MVIINLWPCPIVVPVVIVVIVVRIVGGISGPEYFNCHHLYYSNINCLGHSGYAIKTPPPPGKSAPGNILIVTPLTKTTETLVLHSYCTKADCLHTLSTTTMRIRIGGVSDSELLADFLPRHWHWHLEPPPPPPAGGSYMGALTIRIGFWGPSYY